MLIMGIAGALVRVKQHLPGRLRQFFPEQAVIITQDSYYVSYAELSFSERIKINYDHPDAFEDALLIEHLKQLRRGGEGIAVPLYDFPHILGGARR